MAEDKLSGAGYATLGINTLSGIASGYAETETFKNNLRADSDARISNIDLSLDGFELESVKAQQANRAMEDMFANKLSQRGLEAMKSEALLRTAAAETGTSGGSTNEAIDEAYLDSAMDSAIIRKNRDTTLTNALNAMDIKSASLENKLAMITSGMTSYNGNAAVAGLAGATSVLGTSLGQFSNADRNAIFQFDTKTKV